MRGSAVVPLEGMPDSKRFIYLLAYLLMPEKAGGQIMKRKKTKLTKEDLERKFPITWISRERVASLFGPQWAERFSDEDMEYIADKMAEEYAGAGYSQDLAEILEGYAEDGEEVEFIED